MMIKPAFPPGVDELVVDFVMCAIIRYGFVRSLRGAVLKEIIFLDWLKDHPSQVERFSSTYNWMETNSFIRAQKSDDQIMGA